MWRHNTSSLDPLIHTCIIGCYTSCSLHRNGGFCAMLYLVAGALLIKRLNPLKRSRSFALRTFNWSSTIWYIPLTRLVVVWLWKVADYIWRVPALLKIRKLHSAFYVYKNEKGTLEIISRKENQYWACSEHILKGVSTKRLGHRGNSCWWFTEQYGNLCLKQHTYAKAWNSRWGDVGCRSTRLGRVTVNP